MMIDVARSHPVEVYHALIGLVTPRPIAWVTTVNRSGLVNLAPFSFFNTFGANPPIVVFSPTLRRDGTRKDTLNNVEATGEFVVNAAVDALAEQINLSSKEVPSDESEISLTRLETIPSERVRPPRIALSPAHLECRVRQILPMGTGPIAPNLVIGEVVMIHIQDEILNAEGRIDPAKFITIGRLGGEVFARTTDRFALKRPT